MSPTELKLIPLRVQEGVSYLDLFNRHWRSKAKSEFHKLDMRIIRNSILGLVYDDLFEAYAQHCLLLRDRGFAASPFLEGAGRDTYLKALEAHWRTEVLS